MRISFIVTSYNVAPFIGQCLDSLVPCLRPEDEVIVVDDGSTDRTDDLVERRVAAGFGKGVAAQAILLGANTMGGVGIPANIGLSRATGDAIFFVDGDDFLEPGGFLACRAEFETHMPDILICNYVELDEGKGETKQPADIALWSEVPAASDAKQARALSFAMIAVPWRKFYDRGFLARHSLRFPEGRFFYEDNPFHWQVCRLAEDIRFFDQVLCRHRVNRPGQTMAATGTEFLAFFSHYETIVGAVGEADPQLRAAALEWLVNNMSWHVGRLTPGAYWAYAARAAGVLESEAELWAAIRHRFSGSAIGGMAEALSRGQIAGTVAAWSGERARAGIGAVDRQVQQLRNDIAELRVQLRQEQVKAGDTHARVGRISDQVKSLYHIEEFRALRALGGDLSSQDRSE